MIACGRYPNAPNRTKTARADVIDLTGTTKCELLPDLPRETSSAVGFLVDDTPMVCGGAYNGDKCFSLEITDQGNLNWIETFSFKKTRFGSSAAKLGNSVFVTGGYVPTNQARNSSEILDPNLGWQLGPELPIKLSDHCVTAINETHIILTGGFNSDVFDDLSNTYFFDWPNQRWIRGPSLRLSRNNHMCAYHSKSNSVVVAGGYVRIKDELDALRSKSVEVLNLDSSNPKWVLYVTV